MGLLRKSPATELHVPHNTHALPHAMQLPMASLPYPPWASAPSTLDREDKKERWWKQAKEALKKPWKWKHGREHKSSPPVYTPTTQQDHWRERAPFGAFPPIMAQLSPRPFGKERRFSSPEEQLSQQLFERGTEEATDFELPEYKPPRPLLSNLFTMYDAPAISASKPGGGRRVASPTTSPPPNLGVSGGSSFSHGDRERREDEEEEEGDERKREARERGGERRGRSHTPSADSVGSNDRSMERRQRRTGAVRELPRLPKRSASFDQADVQSHRSLPEVAMHRRRRPTPVPRDMVDYGAPPHHFPRPTSPPRGFAAQNFAYPPWQPHGDGLPPLSEEGDNDDIKGFDSFMMY